MNNTVSLSKSRFDTGNWSPVNYLPGQDDIIHYLEFLLSSDPNKCYTRRELMEAVTKEFSIPLVNTEAEGPKSDTPAFYTRMTYLITDAIQGKRRADNHQFAKRIAFGVYQHITGDGILRGEALQRELKPIIVSKRQVKEALVSVKILKELNHEPEQVICELSHLWSDNVIEAAIKQVYQI